MLFLVGEYYSDKSWGFVGIYDDEEKAKQACGDKEYYFYCPVTLNETAPDEHKYFANTVFPNNCIHFFAG